MNKEKEQKLNELGSASIGVLLIGGLLAMGMLAQASRVLSTSIQSANVRKVMNEGQELGLYAVSATRQLLVSTDTSTPSVGFKNPVDATSLDELGFRSLENIKNPSIFTLTSSQSLRVMGPNMLDSELADVSKIFESKNFQTAIKETQIFVKPYSWEPFETGYGVKHIFLEASTHLSSQNFQNQQTVRARIQVPAPAGSCQIIASQGRSRVVNGAVLQPDSTINFNLSCSGVILTAKLYHNSQLLASDGPVTKANDYHRQVNAMFAPITISASGNHLISADARLVDGSLVPIEDFVFTIQSHRSPSECMYQCTCTQTKVRPACVGTTRFATPFPHTSFPNVPFPELTGNSATDPDQAQILTDWARQHGYDSTGSRWQGVAFPNYPNVLVCGVGAEPDGGPGYFDLYEFDPNNNCEPKFISARGELGCLREGTRINISPDKSRPIEDLRPGDQIWNPIQNRYFTINKVVSGPELAPLVRIRTFETELVMTESHPILTKKGNRLAMELTPGDYVFTQNTWQAVLEIEQIASEYPETVWNFDLKDALEWDDHWLLADGVVVGDLWMQIKMNQNILDH